MSKQTIDGGPAFPALNYIIPKDLEDRHVQRLGQTQGMTLRDYFAAKAMAALIAEPLNEGQASTAWHWTRQMNTLLSGPDITAHAAYMMADAMLRAREQGEPK